MNIKKWDVWLADLNPRMGTEPGKTRPVVVVQTDLLNNTHPSTIICPVSSKIQPEAEVLRVHLKKREGGLIKESDILVDQIRAIDNRRFINKSGKISPKSREKLRQNLMVLLE